MGEEVSHRMGEGANILGAFRGVWRKKDLSVEARMRILKEIAAPTVLSSCKEGLLNARSRKKYVLEMKWL